MNDTVNKKTVLLIILITSFITASNFSMMNVALPVIGRELAMDAVLLGWVVTATILATTAFQVPVGKLADIFGRKKIFLIGTITFTATTLLGALANSAIVLIIARGLAGVGASMLITTGLAILTSVFPLDDRGNVIGANTAAIYLGTSLGPFFGGILTEYLGWRSIFFTSSSIGMLSIFMVVWKLKGEWADAKGEDFDYIGSIVFAIVISAAMYGFSKLPSLHGILIFSFGLSGLVLFIKVEDRVKTPVFDFRVFRSNVVFLLSNLAVLITYCGAFASTFLMSLYLQYIQGFTPQAAGMILVVQPAFMTFFALISGKLGYTFTPRYVATAGLLLNCVGLIMLSILGEGFSLWYVIISLAIFGIGGGLFSSPNANMAMSSVDSRLLGVASGMLSTMRSAGMILSMGITMILFSLYMGDVEVTPEYYPQFLTSMRAAYIIFATLCFCGVFVQFSARTARR